MIILFSPLQYKKYNTKQNANIQWKWTSVPLMRYPSLSLVYALWWDFDLGYVSVSKIIV